MKEIETKETIMAKKSKKSKKSDIESLPPKYRWAAYSLNTARSISKQAQRQGGNPEHAKLVFAISERASTVADGWKGIALEESRASAALVQQAQNGP